MLQGQLTGWVSEYAAKKRSTVESVTRSTPKELFEFICLEKLKRSISPRDFEEMGKIASIRSLQESSSFSKIVTLLQGWFPVCADADKKQTPFDQG